MKNNRASLLVLLSQDSGSRSGGSNPRLSAPSARCRRDNSDITVTGRNGEKESSPRLYLGKQLEKGGTPGTGPLIGDVTERQRRAESARARCRQKSEGDAPRRIPTPRSPVFCFSPQEERLGAAAARARAVRARVGVLFVRADPRDIRSGNGTLRR